MPDPVTPPTPADDEELSPAEEKKFTKFLGKFLAEDDTPEPTHTAPPQGGTIDIGGEVSRALDAREAKRTADAAQKAKDDELTTLRANAAKPKKERGWFSPLFGD